MDDMILVRALNMLAVIHWFGGVGFVTAVVLLGVAAALPGG